MTVIGEGLIRLSSVRGVDAVEESPTVNELSQFSEMRRLGDSGIRPGLS